MADLRVPSFRPRSAMGYDPKGLKITAAPEFVRYLDEIRNEIGASKTILAEFSTQSVIVSPPNASVDGAEAAKQAAFAHITATNGTVCDAAPVSIPEIISPDFSLV